MDAYAVVREAILTGRAVRAVYRGRERLVCPHVIGRKNNTRRAQALFYQFGGQSSTGLEPDGSPANWRCMFLDWLDSVEIIDGEDWHTAPNHSRPQTCVDQIDVEVAF